MPEPTAQCVTGPACERCPFWQRRDKPPRGESAEYLTFRRCSSYLRPSLVGRSTITKKGKVLTAPDARCRSYLPMTNEGGQR